MEFNSYKIDYEQINDIFCAKHDEDYDYYCSNCEKNICYLCKDEH